MTLEISEQWLIIGASRGLGFEFLKAIRGLKDRPHVVAVSRQLGNLSELTPDPFIKFLSCDLAKSENVVDLLEKLKGEKIDRIIYFAGGGPYGSYQSKEWKDHLWAWNVSFLSAAQLLHHFMSQSKLKQFIAIGSAIAEDRPDPNAASYASSKHALRGLVDSVQAEKPNFDLRLFSPGYMNTTLLPKSSWPRTSEGLVEGPERVAADLLSWMQDSKFFGLNWSKTST